MINAANPGSMRLLPTGGSSNFPGGVDISFRDFDANAVVPKIGANGRVSFASTADASGRSRRGRLVRDSVAKSAATKKGPRRCQLAPAPASFGQRGSSWATWRYPRRCTSQDGPEGARGLACGGFLEHAPSFGPLVGGRCLARHDARLRARGRWGSFHRRSSAWGGTRRRPRSEHRCPATTAHRRTALGRFAVRLPVQVGPLEQHHDEQRDLFPDHVREHDAVPRQLLEGRVLREHQHQRHGSRFRPDQQCTDCRPAEQLFRPGPERSGFEQACRCVRGRMGRRRRVFIGHVLRVRLRPVGRVRLRRTILLQYQLRRTNVGAGRDHGWRQPEGRGDVGARDGPRLRVDALLRRRWPAV